MDKDEFWAKLDALGEDQVRENIGLGLYRQKREQFAREWLRRIDQEHSDDKARSKKTISLDILKEAKTNNMLMIVSAVIATIAIIVAALISFLQ